MKKWLTKQQTAKMLDISIPTLERRMRANKITYYKSGESRSCKVRFDKEDVLNYMKTIKIMKNGD
jgi:excisionase family DNA binding protein